MKTITLLIVLLTLSPFSVFAENNSAKNVAYGDHKKQTMDIYWKEGFKDAPILFQIHGGGWQNGDKKGFGSNYSQKLFVEKYGCVLVSPNYRLLSDIIPGVKLKTSREDAQSAAFDDIVKDVYMAVAFMQKHAAKYGGDPKRIIVCGTSAGGHLSAAVAYCNKHDWLKGTQYEGTTLNIIGWYGDSAPLDQSQIGGIIPFKSYGIPIDTVKKNGPPALMITGTADNTVKASNAHNFQKKCQSLGVWSQVIEMQNGGHCCGRSSLGINKEVTKHFDAFMNWITANGPEPESGKVFKIEYQSQKKKKADKKK